MQKSKVIKNFLILFFWGLTVTGCKTLPVISNVGKGWSKTSVNATIFRKNSLVSDSKFQFIAYYDSAGSVVLGKRRLGTNKWVLNKTQYSGNVLDAHNSISIMVDGEGFLHVSWDHHNSPLNYARSVTPGGIILGPKLFMTGSLENEMVTYPEFYSLPDGGMFFVYRYGSSGSGNIVLNRYILKEKRWERVHDNLVTGEGLRNAYWQMAVDGFGTIHLAYVWRDTWDVSTNHNLCYARSTDGGKTWETSAGKSLKIPIKYSDSEIAVAIEQNSNLINQTSITTDASGNPAIATYFRAKGDSLTQFYVVYHDGSNWHLSKASDRKTSFNLTGGGTRRIPISRPQLMATSFGEKTRFYIVYRDEEAGNNVVIATALTGKEMIWDQKVINELEVGLWEPSFDTELWRRKGELNLFIQKVGQGAGNEKAEEIKPQIVKVYQLDNKKLNKLFYNNNQ